MAVSLRPMKELDALIARVVEIANEVLQETRTPVSTKIQTASVASQNNTAASSFMPVAS
jgi:hypothetical protein